MNKKEYDSENTCWMLPRRARPVEDLESKHAILHAFGQNSKKNWTHAV